VGQSLRPAKRRTSPNARLFEPFGDVAETVHSNQEYRNCEYEVTKLND